ncbi:conserved hypothetical protein [Gloeothece citriformis PCC 7424]|uniref:Uncharacterized protein n=1 Tax=Gloeothece citriformis (strain PCC 7424) TaxID=65393 RepID=B7KEZ2_GLOC7|nr:hypothetical protein [Gloeothece citriformis]ACK70448.1 conserved hypothetical protein [Gloeothece citriformis PCC 7424]
MLRLLYNFIHLIDPILVPVCFLLAWTLLILLGSTLWMSTRDTFNRAKKMHQIPCATCRYFTNDYRLKCPVHPMIANTENAIDCSDYQSI